jgi:hypothetical protein
MDVPILSGRAVARKIGAASEGKRKKGKNRDWTRFSKMNLATFLKTQQEPGVF